MSTELSKLLSSSHTAIKNHIAYIVKKSMRDRIKTCFVILKIHVKVLSTQKSRGFCMSIFSAYEFSTFYTILPHKSYQE